MTPDKSLKLTKPWFLWLYKGEKKSYFVFVLLFIIPNVFTTYSPENGRKVKSIIYISIPD
jgi:hypothetical protein